ncbi:MAG TPA: acyltransferase [Dokdonella sp.]
MHAERADAARDYFPGLTGLRGVAAGWVVLYHVWLLADAPAVRLGVVDATPLFAGGFIGVDLFFVLSGFLLGRPFLAWAQRRRAFPSLAGFWKRRCLRVLPAYYAQLAILLVAARVADGAWPVGLGGLLAYLSMEFTYVPGFGPLLNGVWWTLPIEWNFYVVLPLLGLAFARWRAWVVFVAVLAAVLAFRAACYASLADRALGTILYPLIIHLPGRLDEFVCGMLGAWFELRRTRPSPRRDLAALLLGLAGVAGLLLAVSGRGDFFAQGEAPIIFVFASAAGASLGLVVYAAAVRVPLARALFGGRALAFLGTISYSLYLWHGIVFVAAERSGVTRAPALAGLGRLALALIPIVLLVAWLSYRLTEHPFLVTAPATHRDAPPPAT